MQSTQKMMPESGVKFMAPVSGLCVRGLKAVAVAVITDNQLPQGSKLASNTSIASTSYAPNFLTFTADKSLVYKLAVKSHRND